MENVSISSLALDTYEPPELVDHDDEVEIICENVEFKTSKNSGNDYVNLRLKVTEGNYQPFYQILMLPSSSLEEEKANMYRGNILDCLQAFGLLEGELTDLKGLTAFAILKIVSSDGYPDKNQVKKWIPRQ